MFSKFFSVKTSASRSGRVVAFEANSRVDQFEVEAMEPRILLSAAPIDAPIVSVDVSAIADIQTTFDQAVQQSFVTTSEEISPLNVDQGHLFGETSDLPDSQTETVANPDTENNSLTDVDPLVDQGVFSQEQSALIQIDQVTTVSSNNDFVTHTEGVTLVPNEPVTDSVVSVLVTTLNAANGPPAAGDTTTSIDSITSSTSTSTPGLQSEVSGTTNETSHVVGDLSSDDSQNLLNIYPNVLAGDHAGTSGDHLLFNGDATLGTVTTGALSQQQIDELLQVAISLWVNALPNVDISNLTQGITARVADLSGAILGEANGQTISLDTNAAGRGWFVDTTPNDHSEFESVNGQLTALAGSDAAGRIDLLTVLTHEVGHVLGYGHDSGPAIMASTLGAGERISLNGPITTGAPVTVGGHYTFDNGVFSPGHSPGIVNITGNLTTGGATTLNPEPPSPLASGSVVFNTLHIEVGGLTPGPGTPTINNGYDQINVTGDLNLTGGILDLDLLNNFNPVAGQTFDIITYTGSLTGKFASATGLFGFGDGSLFFEIVENTAAKKIQLLVKQVPGGDMMINPAFLTTIEKDALGQFFSEYIPSVSVNFSGVISLGSSNNVYIAGNFTLTIGAATTVDIATGIPGNLSQLAAMGANALSTALGGISTTSHPTNLWIETDFSVIHNVAVQTITVGISSAQVFVGVNGPYWNDLDASGTISFTDAAGVTLSTDANSDGFVDVVGGFGDKNNNGVVDIGESAELNGDAVGVYAAGVNLGLVLMTPTVAGLPTFSAALPTFYALKATVASAGFVGIPGVTAAVSTVEFNVNGGYWSETVAGIPGIPQPTVDFAASFTGPGYAIATGGAPVYIDYAGDGIIGVSAANVTLNLGGYVYISGSFDFQMGGSAVVDVATGLPANLGPLGSAFSSAVGLLPTVDPGDGTLWIEPDFSTIHGLEVETMRLGIGGAQVFVGVNGPYWTDLDGSATISFTNAAGVTLTADVNADGFVDVVGGYGDKNKNGLVDVGESAELNGDAVGVYAAGVDIGFVFMTPTLAELPGFDQIMPSFYAMKATVASAGLVGISGVTATISMAEIQINGGEWPEPIAALGIAPTVNFETSFLAEVTDTDGDGKIDPVGYEIPTGGVNSVYIDYDDNGIIGVSAANVTLNLGGYVHISGSFDFQMGGSEVVDVATGLPANLGPLGSAFSSAVGLLPTVDPGDGTLWIEPDFSTIHGLEVETMRIGIGGAQVFVGINGPYWTDLDGSATISFTNAAGVTLTADANADGFVDVVGGYGDKNKNGLVDVGETAELNGNAVGVYAAGVDIGFVFMTPTLADLPGFDQIMPTFYAMKATVASAGLVGIPGVTATISMAEVQINGGDWPEPIAALGIAPTVNFETSFLAEVTDTDGDGKIDPVGYEIPTGGVNSVYIDYDDNGIIGVSAVNVTLNLGGFVYISGSFDFQMGGSEVVDAATGLPSDLGALGSVFSSAIGGIGTTDPGDGSLWIEPDFSVIHGLEVETMRLGIGGAQVFVGVGGPYWNDLNGDHLFTINEANPNAVGMTIAGVDLGMVMMTPTLAALPGFDQIMPKFYAVKGTAATAGLVGMGNILQFSARGIQIDVNTGSWPSAIAAIPGMLPPAVDFVASFPAETAPTDTDGDGKIDPVGYEVPTGAGSSVYIDYAQGAIGAGAENVTIQISSFVYLTGSIYVEKGRVITPTLVGGLAGDVSSLGLPGSATPFIGTGAKEIETLTIGGTNLHAFVGLGGPYWVDSVSGIYANGLIDRDGSGNIIAAEVNSEAIGLVIDDLDFGILLGKPTNILDPIRYFALKASAQTVRLVGIPGVTANFDDILIELNLSSPSLQGLPILPVINFTSLSGGMYGVKTGAKDINGNDITVDLTMATPLIRAQGFVDLNLFDTIYLSGSVAFELGPRQNVTLTDNTTKSVTTMTIGAANVTAFVGIGGPYWTDTGDHIVQAGELSSTAKGFHITDFDMGLMVMLSTNTSDVGAYLAGSASVNSFGLVNIPYVDATGRLDVDINVGVGMVSGTAVVNLLASFPDTDGAGTDQAGFEVNTGDPSSPVLLDFSSELINIQLGGSLTISSDAAKVNDVFKFSGLFLFEKTSTKLTAFVLASLEVGPDIGASDANRLFNIKALGALVITNTGIAADIDLAVSIGGPLTSLLRFTGTARVVFNTTGVAQVINIPAEYVGFLNGTVSIANTLTDDGSFPSDFSSLLPAVPGTLDSRFSAGAGGSVNFTIGAGAPNAWAGAYNANGVAQVGGLYDAAGIYFLVTMHGNLTLGGKFIIAADFYLKTSAGGLELGLNGTINLGGFVTLNLAGAAAIEADGDFAAYFSLSGSIQPITNVSITGAVVLQINTGSVDKVVYDALGSPHTVTANTQLNVHITAAINLFNLLTANGSVDITIVNGNLSVSVTAVMSFFNIVDINISGYFRVSSAGVVTFSFTGSLNLNLTEGSGALRFGITGGISLTIKDTGISGSGSVALVIFGQSVNVASGTVSVNWATGAWLIRAEGPLSVWLEVSSSPSSPYFDLDGGMGVFQAVFEAIGDAAVAVGEAFAAAAVAVEQAFTDLGNAILDFGASVIDFVDGVITDFVNLLSDIGSEISSWFESSKTVVVDLTGNIVPSNYFTYTTSLVGGVLTVTNSSSSNLSFAIVGGNLIIDAPDTTSNVVVARSDYYTRYFRWAGPIPLGWSSWSLQSSTNYTRDITFSNMTSIAAAGITSIVVNGSNSNETIILDKASVSIATTVYGNGGNDVIVTGNGNDTVYGGTGNDIIFTYGGNDNLYGGDGDDKMSGGIGSDNYWGGIGADYLDENDDRVSPEIAIATETNIMNGEAGADMIIGSPGADTINGGGGDDTLVGLADNDTYAFGNGYGTDRLVDLIGLVTLSFSTATDALTVVVENVDQTSPTLDTGLTATAGAGNVLTTDVREDITAIQLGSGSDTLEIRTLPNILLTLTDAGGSDTVTVNDSADTEQNTGVLTDTRLTGLGMGNVDQTVVESTLGIAFSNIEVMVVLLGSGDDTFTVSGFTGTGTVNGGVGLDTLIATNDVNFTLSDTSLARSGLGTLTLASIQVALLTGGASNNLFTVSGWTGTGTLDGAAGSDTVAATNDLDFILTDTSLVRSGRGTLTLASIQVANLTGGAASNSFTVTGWTGTGSLDGAASIDTLIAVNDLDFDLTDTYLDRSGRGRLNLTSIELVNLTGGVSVNSFTVSNWTGTANLDGRQADDIYTVNLAVGGSGIVNINDSGGGVDTLFVNGTGADDVFVVTNSQVIRNGIFTVTYLGYDLLVINGLAGNDLFTVNGLTIPGIMNGGDGVDTFVINSNFTVLTVNGDAGADDVTINGASNAITVNGGTENDTITVNGSGALLTLNGEDGADLITINNSSAAITANGGIGDDTFRLRGFTAAVTIDTGTGVNAIHIGSVELPSLGNVNSIGGNVTITGNGTDSLTVNDAGDVLSNIGMLTSSQLTGLGMTGYVDFTSVETMLVALAAGGSVLNIRSTHSATTTTVRTGTGSATLNIGSLAPSTGGDVNSIAGKIFVVGEGTADIINIDDTIDGASNTGILTSTLLTGLGMGDATRGIDYANVEFLNIHLGNGGNTFNIQSTFANTQTTLDTGTGSDTVNFGSLAPATGGNVNAVAGLVIVNGQGGSDTMNVDDTGDAGVNAGVLTSSRLTGLGMGDATKGIDYSNFEFCNVNLGTGADTFNIQSTLASVLTTVNTGAGANANVINMGSLAPAIGGTVNSISGRVVVNGQSTNETINVDDTGDATDNSAVLTGSRLTGLGMGDATKGLEYYNIETLNINLGSANDTFNVQATTAVTNIEGNGGNDRFFVSSTANYVATDVVTGLSGNLDGILGVLNLNGGTGAQTLMISDASAVIGDTNVLITDQLFAVANLSVDREISITGLAPAAMSYRADAAGNFSGGITLYSGSGADNIVIDGTHRRGGTTTTLYTGYGSDHVTVTLDAATDGTFVLDTEGPNNAPAVDNDFVNATNSTLPLVIRTGQGDDFIVGGQEADTINSGTGSDIVFGGAGADVINAGADSSSDVVIGDNGFISFYQGSIFSIYSATADFTNVDWIAFESRTYISVIGSSDAAIGGNDVIDVGAGNNIVIGGSGADSITGGADADVVIGDNGSATFDASGVLTFITTTDEALAGSYNDVIITGNGFNTLLGGNGVDTVTGGNDTDVVLGDNGSATFVNSLGVSLLTNIVSTDATIGGDDVISVGSGRNSIIGGFGADQITGGANEDVVIGDNGQASFNLSGILTSITTIDPTIGGVDIIQVGDGYNVVIGGFGGDQITGGADRDVVVGDNGSTTFSATGILLSIGTLDPTIGGVDIILTGDGDNTVLGGIGGDQITGGDGRDVVIGDNGSATFDATGVLTFITTSDAALAGAYNDVILTGDGFNSVLGGNGVDTITGAAGTDVILGDNGSATFVNVFGVSLLTNIISTDETIGADDIISVGSGFNAIIGGFGADQITGGADQDVVIGDNGEAVFNVAGFLTFITTIFPAIGGVDIIQAGDGYNVVIGGFGGDQITGGADRDVVVGDNGSTTFDATGILLTIGTLDPTIGGVDTIITGAGDNTVLGGIGGDQITGGDGRDVVIGDNGNAIFDASGVLTFITTSDAGLAGAYDDVILTGNGFNTVLGGNGADTITGGNDTDVVLGDNGSATFVNSLGVSLLTNIVSTDTAIGDDDVISVGNGFNTVIGGFGADQITGGDDRDVIIGDNGEANFSLLGILTTITTTLPGIGGVDVIYTGLGDNAVLGGFGGDLITGGDGRDVVVGDNGNATFDASGVLIDITTSDPTIGGVDIIQVGNGFNTVLGGIGGDEITGGNDRDVVIGDNGNAQFNGSGVLVAITTTDSAIGDVDLIFTGDGNNVALGGFGADEITGGNDGDVVVGDNGQATFTNAGILTFITTLAPTIGGSDIILVGDGDNAILGGIGEDQITGGNDRDVVIGDNGNMTFDTTGVLIGLLTTDAALPGAYDDVIFTGNGFNTVLGGNGVDQVTGGNDRDVVLGDNGSADFINDSGVSLLQLIVSTDDAIGGDDIISVGNGRNTVIGGFGADQITGGLNEDVVVGDNGRAEFNTVGILTYITTTSPDIGGVDVILVSDGENTVLGGFGGDQITGGADRDVVVGDNGNATFTDAGVLTYITTTDPAIGGDDVIFTGSGDNAVLGGYGSDEITAGNDRDVVIGDNGNATFDTTGVLLLARTSDAAVPGTYDDVIFTGNGFNTVLAGNGNDSVTGGNDRDVVLGDNGSADFINASGVSLLQLIVSTDDAIGGDDIISVGNGRNTVIGGFGADQITGGLNEDVVVGDNGRAEFNTAGILTYITTTSPDIGGVDVILVSDGENTVLGGFGGDQITGGADRDVVVGDNGNATFTDLGVLTYITTSEPSIGGDDVIFTGNGDNTVLGGIGADVITGGIGRDVVIGDNGNATFDTTGVLLLALTSDAAVPGNYDDVIITGNGFNTVLAGNGNDQVTGGNGRDVVIGDNGMAIFDNIIGISQLREILSTDTAIGGDDIIIVGNGRNTMIGGFGMDLMMSGIDDDVAVGDNGHAFFSIGGVLTYITTISPEIGDIDTIYVSDGDNTVIGGFQGDFINSGAGRDVILGDNGNATFNNNDVLIYITTTEPSIGDVDVIDAGDGDNVVIGGQAGDVIRSGNGRDVVIGDNGYAEFNAFANLTFVTTTDPIIGGDDLINAGDGDNVVLAGYGADEVVTGINDDIVVGDNGYAIFNNNGFVTYVTTTEPDIGGDDLIDAGDGYNIVMGGFGSDHITSGTGQDVVLGDNGYAVFVGSGILTYVTTSSPEIGGDDLIDTGGGNDLVFGGQGADTIDTGAGGDLALGDNGYAVFDSSGNPTFVTTTEFDLGGNDVISAGSGDDLVMGGFGDDYIYGEDGDDTLVGDQAYWSILLDTPRFVELIDERLPGDDHIYGGNSMDLILSGGGDDWNEGGNDNDTIFAGRGNDFLWGGAGRDRLAGGPNDDWIDGGFGRDFIYVDVFDVWAHGFPNDTVIMGRMTTTGLLFNNDLIRNYGDLDAGNSAASNVLLSMSRLLESGQPWVAPVFMDEIWTDSSPILGNVAMKALLARGYDAARWGGEGSAILLLSIDRFGVPQLIGIGDFIEQHWSDLLALYN